MNTWAEAMKAIGALEDRVKKLEGYCFGTQQASSESSIKPGEVVSMPGEFRFFPLPPRRTEPSHTHDGRIVVGANEYARLARLDCEVRAFLSWLAYPGSGLVDRNSSILEGMREALKR